MYLDKFSNPIFNEQDIFDALYQGHTDILMNATVESTDEIEKLSVITQTHLLKSIEVDNISIEQFDQYMQSNWHMPDEYKQYDIVDWLYCQCKTIEQKDRVTEELQAFAERDMIMLLKWLKYFVDTCSKKQIVWGIGRGSSVASYVLYLIGVHSVDSIKYNLDWQEFLR
jgi:DNA polymerase III alpha subunit